MWPAYQDALNDLHFDVEVTLRSPDLRSTRDLELISSSYTHFDACQRENLDGTAIFVLAQLVQVIGNNSFDLKCRYFDFFDSDVIFDLT